MNMHEQSRSSKQLKQNKMNGYMKTKKKYHTPMNDETPKSEGTDELLLQSGSSLSPQSSLRSARQTVLCSVL